MSITDTIAAFDEYQQQRYEKQQALRDAGVEPYPRRSERTHDAQAAIAVLESQPEDGDGPAVVVAGRVVAIRRMGKASFLHIEDRSGRLQLYLRQDEVGTESYDRFKSLLDLGDFIEAHGPMFRTRTGEATVRVERWEMLAKALNQPPDKHHGLTDTEQRYRERYVDLFANPETRDLFVTRSRLTSIVRDYMEAQGFLEVETPILQPLYGGAAARPFVTHHNWAKRDLYLRIAPELFLKRLIVGGLERVFEIGRDFRNEGLSWKHNPEFTMLEAYQAYADYTDMMALVEGCWSHAARELLGTTVIQYDGHEIDVAPPWRRLTLRDAILQRTEIDIYEATTREALQAEIDAQGLEIDPKPTWGTLVDELFSETVEATLIQPTLILDYPFELSPFAKRTPHNPLLVERFEPFIGGMEIGNAFTEINDPLEQLERFLDQQRQRAAGDEETQPIDRDYINALMYGMPPTGGIGWGMDRMAMLFTNRPSIREVILFPTLRAAGDEAPDEPASGDEPESSVS